MTDTRNDHGARWAAAASLADGVPDDTLTKRRGRVLIRIAALVVGSWIVGVILAVVFLPGPHSASRDHSTHTNQQLTAQLVFLGLGLVIGVGGFIWGKRTGHYITRWRAVISPLNRDEKKSVRRQISGKEAPDPAHLPVVVAIAHQNRRSTLGVAPLYFALLLFAVATAIGTDQLFIKVLELAVSLLFVAAAIQLVVLYRRSGRFIAQHATSPS